MLVMEFMDGGTLFDVLAAVHLEEGQIGAVCREVRDPACASPGLPRMLLASCRLRRAEISCSHLSFAACAAAVSTHRRRKSMASEVPAAVPALLRLCSCTLPSCLSSGAAARSLAWFHLLPLLRLPGNVCLEPVCMSYIPCHWKAACRWQNFKLRAKSCAQLQRIALRCRWRQILEQL